MSSIPDNSSTPDNSAKSDDRSPSAGGAPEGRPSQRKFRKRRVRRRDLSQAEGLRPNEVYLLYGIPASTLCEYCKDRDPAKRLPSRKIEGRSGHRGVRIIIKTELVDWLEKRRS